MSWQDGWKAMTVGGRRGQSLMRTLQPDHIEAPPVPVSPGRSACRMVRCWVRFWFEPSDPRKGAPPPSPSPADLRSNERGATGPCRRALVKPVGYNCESGEREAAVARTLQPQLELEGGDWSVTDSCCWGDAPPPPTPSFQAPYCGVHYLWFAVVCFF